MSVNTSSHRASAGHPSDPRTAVSASASGPAKADRSLLLRGSLITILLAGLAAFLGARLGSQPPQLTMPLSERVFELIDDSIQLSASQRETIDQIALRYAPEREELLLQSRSINVRVATRMAEEGRLGPLTEEALADLQDVMGERLKHAARYTLEVREVLTPEQRELFDRTMAEEASRAR